jgi:hypothetical protein
VRVLAMAAALALSTALGSGAQAVEVITFEELAAPPVGAGTGLAVLNFYASRGIIFDAAAALDFSQDIPNFARSGTKAIETCVAAEFCTSPIAMSFTRPQARVKAWAGASFPPSQPLTVVMRAFAGNGAQVGQATAVLNASPAPVPIRTPLEIALPTATIVHVTIDLEAGGAPTTTAGLGIDDVEFDVAGPPPVCKATRDPTVSISQPPNGEQVQFNQFPLAFRVNTGDPFAVTTITDTSSNAPPRGFTLPGFNGAFGPTTMNNLLVPGPSTVTVAVKDCHGTAQAAVGINFTPIAADEVFHTLGFEVTQAIQNVPGSVPLVAGKPTLVRVYLNVTGGTTRVTGVRGKLIAFRPANDRLELGPQLQGVVASSNAIAVDASPDLKLRRVSLASSLNFELPADWIVDGALHVQVALDVDGAPTSPVNIPCLGCANTLGAGAPSFAHFLTMPTLRLRIIGLQYAFGTPPTLQAPRQVDFDLFESWVRRAYPAGAFEIFTSTVTARNPWPFDCNAANAQLSAQRAIDIDAGQDPHTHYLALVITTGGFIRGCASGVPEDSPDTSVVATSPTGNPATDPRPFNAVGDTDASFGDWYAGHELAHQFGRAHPGFCNGNSQDDDHFPNPNGQISDNLQTHVGLDKGDAPNAVPEKVISPFAFDIMTYCNQPQWFSAYNYMAVMQRLRAENNLPLLPEAQFLASVAAKAPAQPLANEAVTGDFVNVVALVNLTRGTATFEHVDPVTRAAVPAPHASPTATLRFRDKSGKVIGSFPVWVRLDSDLPAGADRTGLVQAAIPKNHAAAHLDLLLGDKIAATRAISAHAPEVKGLALATRKAVCGPATEEVLKWVGSDPDGDKLTYLVQLGGPGERWETIAIGLRQHELALTEAQRRGPPAPRQARVIANDGYNVSTPAIIDLTTKK